MQPNSPPHSGGSEYDRDGLTNGFDVKRLWTGTRTRFATTGELIRSFWNGPYWWLVPVVLLLLPAAVIFVFLQAYPVVAPFVYTVF